MNIVLLSEEDCIAPQMARLQGRRLQHVREVHRANVGDTLRVGMLSGLMGQAEVLSLSADELVLHFQLSEPPPPKLPLTIVLALSRPKMMKRIFQTIAAMGVSRLVLLNSYRVEKSFWASPWLTEAAITEQLLLGLEQARDTVLPTIIKAPLFKPFVEDQLPTLSAGTQCLLAHPGSAQACPVGSNIATTLVIGPEGGFIPYEVEKLQAAGFQAVHMGERILRVETAVTALTARLFV